MNLGPRAGDIVASFEDLVFTAASVMVFLGPVPPTLTVPPPPPPPLSPATGVVAPETGAFATNRNDSVSLPPMLPDASMIGETSMVTVGKRTPTSTEDGVLTISQGPSGNGSGSFREKGSSAGTRPSDPSSSAESGTPSALACSSHGEVCEVYHVCEANRLSNRVLIAIAYLNGPYVF